jgi:hypothetical protein
MRGECGDEKASVGMIRYEIRRKGLSGVRRRQG